MSSRTLPNAPPGPRRDVEQMGRSHGSLVVGNGTDCAACLVQGATNGACRQPGVRKGECQPGERGEPAPAVPADGAAITSGICPLSITRSVPTVNRDSSEARWTEWTRHAGSTRTIGPAVRQGRRVPPRQRPSAASPSIPFYRPVSCCRHGAATVHSHRTRNVTDRWLPWPGHGPAACPESRRPPSFRYGPMSRCPERVGW
jgi:hypothetical protein